MAQLPSWPSEAVVRTQQKGRKPVCAHFNSEPQVKEGREGRGPAKWVGVSVKKFEGLAAYSDACFLSVLLTEDEWY